MSASKQRPAWNRLPRAARAAIEAILAGRVFAALSCPGGFSPGFASRLVLADGRRVFVKAVDAHAWPDQAGSYRAEVQIAASLPDSVPAPRLLGSVDDDRWVILAFEDIDGHEPTRPWTRNQLDRVLTATGQLSQALTPSPLPLPTEHPDSAAGPTWPPTGIGGPGWQRVGRGQPTSCRPRSRWNLRAWPPRTETRWSTSTCIPTTSC
jgi:hypothetical protein